MIARCYKDGALTREVQVPRRPDGSPLLELSFYENIAFTVRYGQLPEPTVTHYRLVRLEEQDVGIYEAMDS